MTDRRTKEALRYLGYGTHAADERTLELVRDCFRDLETYASAKSVCRIFDCVPAGPESLRIGKMEIHSRSLGKNLAGCEKAAVFGATLGTGVDRLMRTASLTDMARAVSYQACAAALLEKYCDEIQRKLEKEAGEEGLWVRPRFSPGYGDFDIRHQRDILEMLDAPKVIGLSMTDGYMLTPVKSVTALAGLSRVKADCHIHGCEECQKTDCAYRRSP